MQCTSIWFPLEVHPEFTLASRPPCSVERTAIPCATRVRAALLCTALEIALEIIHGKEKPTHKHAVKAQRVTSLTVVESMMFIRGNSRTGRRAVTASGKASVHQNSAISMMTKPHWASCRGRARRQNGLSTSHSREKATAHHYSHRPTQGSEKRLFSLSPSRLSCLCRS